MEEILYKSGLSQKISAKCIYVCILPSKFLCNPSVEAGICTFCYGHKIGGCEAVQTKLNTFCFRWNCPLLYHFDLRFMSGHSHKKWALLKFATNQKSIFWPSRRPKITKLMNLRSKWYSLWETVFQGDQGNSALAMGHTPAPPISFNSVSSSF